MNGAEGESEQAAKPCSDSRRSGSARLPISRWCCGELADRRGGWSSLIQEKGDLEAMAQQLAALEREKQEASEELALLQKDRNALGSPDVELEQQRLQEKIEGLQNHIEQLIDQRGAAKQRCDSISSSDPFAAVEQARLQLGLAEADHRQLLRLTEAHQLLLQLFQEAQADLSSQQANPSPGPSATISAHWSRKE